MPTPDRYAHPFTHLTYVYISKLGLGMVSNCLMSFCLSFVELRKFCAIIEVII